MPLDLFEIGMVAVGLLSLGLAVLVMAWPTRDEIDVMQRVHGDQPLARGLVAIDAEGVPPVIFWEGDAFLPIFATPDLMPDCQTYRKVRVMHAGFERVLR